MSDTDATQPPSEPAATPESEEDPTIGRRVDEKIQALRDEVNPRIDAIQAQLDQIQARIDAAQGQNPAAPGQVAGQPAPTPAPVEGQPTPPPDQAQGQSMAATPEGSVPNQVDPTQTPPPASV